MSTLRRTRRFGAFGLVAALMIGFSVSSAEAGGHKFHRHGHFHRHFHGHRVNYRVPMVKRVVKPYVYPVLLYDCYGQPYYSWQTRYRSVRVSYWP
jgi:hypothetical protein